MTHRGSRDPVGDRCQAIPTAFSIGEADSATAKGSDSADGVSRPYHHAKLDTTKPDTKTTTG